MIISCTVSCIGQKPLLNTLNVYLNVNVEDLIVGQIKEKVAHRQKLSAA